LYLKKRLQSLGGTARIGSGGLHAAAAVRCARICCLQLRLGPHRSGVCCLRSSTLGPAQGGRRAPTLRASRRSPCARAPAAHAPGRETTVRWSVVHARGGGAPVMPSAHSIRPRVERHSRRRGGARGGVRKRRPVAEAERGGAARVGFPRGCASDPGRLHDAAGQGRGRGRRSCRAGRPCPSPPVCSASKTHTPAPAGSAPVGQDASRSRAALRLSLLCCGAPPRRPRSSSR